jgi:hypothetical protein
MTEVEADMMFQDNLKQAAVLKRGEYGETQACSLVSGLFPTTSGYREEKGVAYIEHCKNTSVVMRCSR